MMCVSNQSNRNIRIGLGLRRALTIGAVSITLAVSGASVHAQQPKPIPFSEKSTSIESAGMPVSNFLEELFARDGLSVEFSTELKTPIRGRFVGTPESIWKNVSRAFNIDAGYDGTSVRVFPYQHPEKRNIRNSLLLKPAMNANSKEYEVRIFYLKHIATTDKTIETINGPVVKPGAVSILRSVMGSADSGSGPRISTYGKTNQIIIADKPEAMRTYEAMLSQLDLAPNMFEIDAHVFDIDIEKARNIGLLKDDSVGSVISLIQTGSVQSPSEAERNSAVMHNYDNAIFIKNINRLAAEKIVLKLHSQKATIAEGDPALFSQKTPFAQTVTKDGKSLELSQNIGFALQVMPRQIVDKTQETILINYVISDSKVTEMSADGPVVEETKLTRDMNVRSGKAVLIFMEPQSQNLMTGADSDKSKVIETPQYRRVVIFSAKLVTNPKHALREAIGTNSSDKDANPS